MKLNAKTANRINKDFARLKGELWAYECVVKAKSKQMGEVASIYWVMAKIKDTSHNVLPFGFMCDLKKNRIAYNNFFETLACEVFLKTRGKSDYFLRKQIRESLKQAYNKMQRGVE